MSEFSAVQTLAPRAGASRERVLAQLDEWLLPSQFKDYGPNGLQVQGKDTVGKLVTGVTASLALLQAAAKAGADAVLVHHGLFWRGHDGRLTGWLRERVACLMAHDINLLAYHLPMDAHPLWGNNAQLGLRLQLKADAHFGDQALGFIGDAGPWSRADQLGRAVHQALGRLPVLVPGDGRPLRRVAWCTGGAQAYFEDAIAAGADAFITGEISEPQAHVARETGVAFLAGGHHATERYGVQALGEQLAATLGVDHEFIELDNPA